MTIENIPVWPFEPNWSGNYTEALEWLTDILASNKGAEQRRSLRPYPRKSIEFSTAVSGNERERFQEFVESHGGRNFYLPQWHEAHRSTGTTTLGGKFIPCVNANNGAIVEGDVIFIGSHDTSEYELAEVESVSSIGIVTVNVMSATWAAGSRLHPVRKARLEDQPVIRKLSDKAVTFTVNFRIMERNDDVPLDEIIRETGPLIMNGLVANAYHDDSGRAGYFHQNSGTSESQLIFIHGAFSAYEALRNGTLEEKITSDYYLKLAYEALDAIGDGSTSGPMLRQAVPTSNNTITMMNHLFAARADVPEQTVVYDLQLIASAGKLVIPRNANGAAVHRVWQIYPATSALLYESPFSPSYDIDAPATNTSLEITDWERIGDTIVISIPQGAPAVSEWKVVYGYSETSTIPMSDGYEAFPSWSRIAPGYVVSAPDTFRWFDLAMDKAIALDSRAGAVLKWGRLRAAMRKTAVRAQSITDHREVFKPTIGFAAIPPSGEPMGMHCYSNHPSATPPIAPGIDNNWIGYDFWSRDNNGDILANVPDSNQLSQVLIGRYFPDTWRESNAYQEADSHLYLQMSMSRLPDVDENEAVLVYISSSKDIDPNQRWYADISTMAGFDALTGDVNDLFIAQSEFKLRFVDEDGVVTWGTSIPTGTLIEDYGIVSEMVGDSYQIRIRSMRPVAQALPEAVRGAPMVYFPGSMPFVSKADTIRQQFVGGNGMPFHGYQMPDLWLRLASEANDVHAGIGRYDLPVIDRNSGWTDYPISITTSSNVTKPANAMLMEQQLLFLKHAQLQWVEDGGQQGPFAHTVVLNTRDRDSIGNPTPHTWVYVNENPNTRWVGYQLRVVESLATIISSAASEVQFEDAVALAEEICTNWLSWVNLNWPSLNGNLVDGRLVYGMPSEFDDPHFGQPRFKNEDPYAAALLLKSCLQLERVGKGDSAVNNALMSRCWAYLELLWQTTGEMAGTWSPDPLNKTWYGFAHGEILSTLSEMLTNSSVLPSDIDGAIVRQRINQTAGWLQEHGVSYSNAGVSVPFLDTYDGFNVIIIDPDDGTQIDFSFARNIEELDNQTSLPVFYDVAGMPFPTQKHTWTLHGRSNYEQFKRSLYMLRGRAISMWLPSFMNDMTLINDTPVGERYLEVQRFGFAESGALLDGHRRIVIFYNDGTRDYRRITGSAIGGQDTEILSVDQPFYEGIDMKNVLRISFMRLSRLDHDRVEVAHETDTQGVSRCTTTFKAAPNIRIVKAGF